MGAVFSTIEDNEIDHIATRRDLSGAEIAGIKLHAAIDVTIRRNRIHHCIRGLWLDWEAQGTRVSRNLFHDNMPPEGTVPEGSLGEDILIEVSHGPTLIDHNLLLSVNACQIRSQGIAMVHNLICGSFTYVGGDVENKGGRFPSPRYTPYHVPHDTRIAGFMTILHGDMRFYNNIFLQRPIRPELQTHLHMRGLDVQTKDNLICGTFVYDGYPTTDMYMRALTDAAADPPGDKERFYDHLPVDTGGNAFLGGARPCDHEIAYHRDEEHEIHLTLSEEDGELVLATDLYDYLPRGNTRTMSTSNLGMAFEPEQRFEDSDGNDLILDQDYLGVRRGIHPMCGPFEEPAASYVVWTDTEQGWYPQDSVDLEDSAGSGEDEPGSVSVEPLKQYAPHDSGDFIEAVRDVREQAVEAIREAQAAFSGGEAAEPAHTDGPGPRQPETVELGREDIPEPDPGLVRQLQSDIALTNCGDISFPFEGALFQLSDIFVRGDVCWLRGMQGNRLIEVDCAYGIYRVYDRWEMRTMEALDVQLDVNMEGMAQTIGTLVCILNRSMVHDADEACRSISERVNEALEPRGIVMRFTPRYLKFIRDKKFISLEDVLYRINRVPLTIVTEVLSYMDEE